MKLEEDMIDIGYIAVQDYTDPVSCKPRMRYVDPQYLIVASNRVLLILRLPMQERYASLLTES